MVIETTETGLIALTCLEPMLNKDAGPLFDKNVILSIG